MKHRITVRWEVFEQGEVEIPLCEVDGMTDDEIREWVYEGAEMLFSQVGYGVSLKDLDYALREVKEAREAQDDEDNG